MAMKRVLAAVAALVLTVGLLAGGAFSASAEATGYPLPENRAIYSDVALLVNLGSKAENDTVIYAKNADEVHAPASMIRYMVVAYALTRVQEQGLDMDAVTGTYTLDLFNNFVAGTGVPTANMNFGESWTLRDLIAASFLQSASDAVTVLAVTIDGSVSAFVKGMNDLSQKIGCDFTHFANVTGLDSLAQYTTARDVYRIIRYAQTFSVFEELVGNRTYTVHPTAGGTARTLVSVNHMQNGGSTFYYSPLAFSRTGLSDREGRTCASVARDSGYEYLTVVMACPETNAAGQGGLHYLDTRTLFRWAFNSFHYTTVLARSEILASVKVRLAWNTDRVNLVPEREYATVIEAGMSNDQIIRRVTVDRDVVNAPVQKGDVLGKVELIVNVDQKIGEVPLVASESISRNGLMVVFSFLGSVVTSGWFWLAFGVLLLLVIGYIVLNVVYNRRRHRRFR